MFCTKCGNQVLSSDRFCSKCGAEIKRIRSQAEHSYDDDVFDPPFKREAERKTEEIIAGFAPERTAYKDRAKSNAHIELKWNNSDYPTAEKKKTEEIDFDWSSILDKKKTGAAQEDSFGMKAEFEPIIPIQEVEIKQLFPESAKAEDGNLSGTRTDFSFTNPDLRNSGLLQTAIDAENEETNYIYEQLSALFNQPLEQSKTKDEEAETENTDSESNSTEAESTSDEAEAAKAETADSASSEAEAAKAEIESAVLSDNEFETSFEGMSDTLSKTIAYTPIKSAGTVVKSEFELEPKELDDIDALDNVVEIDIKEENPSDLNETESNADEAGNQTEQKAEEFSDAQAQNFNTFIEKQEAFKALLEKERQKIQELEGERSEFESVISDSVLESAESGSTESDSPEAVLESKEETKEEIIKETKEEAKEETNEEIIEEAEKEASDNSGYDSSDSEGSILSAHADASAVVIAGAFEENKEMNPQDELIEEIPEESDSTNSDSVDLRYSDIFPAVDGGDRSSDRNGRELQKQKAQTLAELFDEYEEEKVNKHIFMRIIIILLLVVVVGEGMVLAAKLVNPESKISVWSDNVVTKVADIFLGDKTEEQGTKDDDQGEETSDSVYWDGVILEEASDLETIGEVGYMEDLTFAMIQTPAFAEIANCGGFTDKTWYTDEENMDHTYAEAIVACLAKYYDSWLGANTDESLVGINSFDIGEVRSSDEGFYVLVKVTFAASDGNIKEVYETVNILLVDQTAVVNEVREEKVQ